MTAGSVIMGGTNIKETEVLSALGMKIQCDIRWNEHISRSVANTAFKFRGFYFTPSNLLTISNA